MSYLRDYQEQAKSAVFEALTNGSHSTLVVQPTGTGKTELYLDVAHDWPKDAGEILVLAHRQELVYQPAERYYRKTGERPEIVMAEFAASNLRGRHRIVIGSVPTLGRVAKSRKTSAVDEDGWIVERDEIEDDKPDVARLKATFPDPKRVGLVIIDEAHHAALSNKSYSRILEYLDHPNLRVLGLTATPDRADEEALGQVFDSVAFEYPLFDPAGGPSAISEGWLVPIHQEYVVVEDLDLTHVGSRGGDFVDSSLQAELMKRGLYKLTTPTMELAKDQKTLVFTAGIEQAIEMAAIFNAASDGSSMAFCSRIPDDKRYGFVVNSGDKDERRRHLRRYTQDEFQYLLNMGIFTEGWDEPTVKMICHGRPTKSRALYAQMTGRGTRIFPGVIESLPGTDHWRLETAAERKEAIAGSQKPHLTVLDFVGNSRHSLMSAVDILGGKSTDEVIDRAKAKLGKRGGNVEEALRAAELDLERELEERRKIQARATYHRQQVNPFDVIGVTPTREAGWFKGKKPSEKMKTLLVNWGIEQHLVDRWSHHEASTMIGSLIKRREQGLATYKQTKLLRKFGQPTDVSFDVAKSLIDRIAANNWQPIAIYEREPGDDF